MNGSFLLRRRPPARLAVGLLPPSARLVLSSAAPGSASYPEKERARWAWSSGRAGEGKIALGREERVELKALHAALSSCGIHAGLEQTRQSVGLKRMCQPAWWLGLVILALGRLRRKDCCEFKASLSYVVISKLVRVT